MTSIRTFIYAGLFSAAGLISAQAMPLGAGAPSVPSVESGITSVAEGCGRGYFRNARGFCRPMRPAMRRMAPRACPRGTVLTRRGVCVARWR